MAPSDPRVDAAGPSAEQIEAIRLASRALVAVTAQSLASVEDRVTLPQFRILVILASRGPQNLRSVARGLGVNPSAATRLCNKLVAAGLLHRTDDPADRRYLKLRLTTDGYQLVQSVIDQRSAAIATVLAKMPPQLRDDLLPALRAFADAAGEVPERPIWALGWTTDEPGRLHTKNTSSGS
ncbi:MAG: MarR family transcriptional regulator [Pseudonocardiales bacterium]|nr:MarR family transcriptional regulator [Pseudonocardiales bacterium]